MYNYYYYNVTGKNPSKKERLKFKQLNNYQKNKFQNPDNYQMKIEGFRKLLKGYVNRSPNRNPSQRVPYIKTNLCALKETVSNGRSNSEPTFVWFGHSSYMIYLNGFTILVDPVFSGHASPFTFMVKAFDGANEYSSRDMPEIDLLLLTHDHYDHLDYKTILELKDKVKCVVAPLGVGSHFIYWGYNTQIIHELNWHDSFRVNKDIRITATPAKHTSGRGTKWYKTLWASFILDAYDKRIFLGGDSGYHTHFRSIGEKYGPFDLAIIENGQYNPLWHDNHLFPEEVILVIHEIQAKKLFPVHWAKFSLSFHPWNEPIKRLLPLADALDIPVTVPMIGQPFSLKDPDHRDIWWDFD